MQPTRRNFLFASAAALTVAPPAQAKPGAAKWIPKLSENLADVNSDTLRWLKQLGCQHVICRPHPPQYRIGFRKPSGRS